eukprot:TRINITY_DN779893_c0_g1_i1.p1 TRINITY_DN779893_c0_g1~~TRINITY_DN779893_c0_g1_i1.p1  ORF type:complete len:167 (+),score=51.29 TRINITY_DN779893_c0_g1_i1:169-669(+)
MSKEDFERQGKALSDEQRFNVLYNLTEDGNEETLKVLLEIECFNKFVNQSYAHHAGSETTLLTVAALLGHLPICKLLIDSGAKLIPNKELVRTPEGLVMKETKTALEMVFNARVSEEIKEKIIETLKEVEGAAEVIAKIDKEIDEKEKEQKAKVKTPIAGKMRRKK